jgi:hypothetical protein
MGYEPHFGDVATTEAKEIFSGVTFPILSESIKLAKGQVLTKGALLGKKKDGEYVLSLAAATDSSKAPIRILAEDMDTTAKAKPTIAYKTGQFIADELTYGEGHTTESIRDNLELRSMFLE